MAESQRDANAVHFWVWLKQRIQELTLRQLVGCIVVGVGFYWHSEPVVIAGLGAIGLPLPRDSKQE